MRREKVVNGNDGNDCNDGNDGKGKCPSLLNFSLVSVSDLCYRRGIDWETGSLTGRLAGNRRPARGCLFQTNQRAIIVFSSLKNIVTGMGRKSNV